MKIKKLAPALFAGFAAVSLSLFTISCDDNDSDLEDAAEEVGDAVDDAADELDD